MNRTTHCFIAVCLLAGLTRAAGAQGTLQDYQRSDRLQSLTSGKVFKARVLPHWFRNNNRFWYRNDLLNATKEFILADAERGTRDQAFDHKRLAAGLSKATG